MAGKQLGFGLVTLPVKLVTCAISRDLKFNNVTVDGNRVKSQSIDAVTLKDVTGAPMNKGIEYAKGSYVILTPDEIAACAPAKDDLIEVQIFVDESDVDPLLYEKNRYVVPDKAAMKPYSLLVEAMVSSRKVGIARMVESNREQLVVVRVVGKAMVLSTLYFSHEFKSADQLGLVEMTHTAEELDLAKTLIGTREGEFQLAEYSDSFRDRLMGVIEARATGTSAPKMEPAVAVAPGPTDLMAALKQSIEAAGQKPAAAKKAKVA